VVGAKKARRSVHLARRGEQLEVERGRRGRGARREAGTSKEAPYRRLRRRAPVGRKSRGSGDEALAIASRRPGHCGRRAAGPDHCARQGPGRAARVVTNALPREARRLAGRRLPGRPGGGGRGRRGPPGPGTDGVAAAVRAPSDGGGRCRGAGDRRCRDAARAPSPTGGSPPHAPSSRGSIEQPGGAGDLVLRAASCARSEPACPFPRCSRASSGVAHAELLSRIPFQPAQSHGNAPPWESRLLLPPRSTSPAMRAPGYCRRTDAHRGDTGRADQAWRAPSRQGTDPRHACRRCSVAPPRWSTAPHRREPERVRRKHGLAPPQLPHRRRMPPMRCASSSRRRPVVSPPSARISPASPAADQKATGQNSRSPPQSGWSEAWQHAQGPTAADGYLTIPFEWQAGR
jgi:hypothetical protein